MEQKHDVSEVARIRANIEAECGALRNLRLFSQCASHQIIATRFQALDAYHQELRAAMPEQEATALLVAIYTDVVQ